MPKGIIQVCYRKIIDQSAAKAWEKFVFDDSFSEFLMQVQLYNQEKKYYSFAELVRNVPNVDKLHFLVSASVVGYVSQLNGIIPDIINTLGKQFLPFKNYRFEIINSDIRSKAAHQVAINFFSEPLLWHDTIGGNLLVSAVSEDSSHNDYITDMFTLQPMISICSFKTGIYD